jgi:drug/metabolite transporter (DMT)-like permease
MIVAQRTTGHIPGLTSGILVITGTCLTLLLIGVGVGASGMGAGISVPGSLDAWLPLLGLAFFSTVIGVAALLAGMRYIGAARASLIAASGPPTSLVFAALIFGEKLTLVQYLGGALVIASVLLVNLSPKAVRRAEDSPTAGIS